MLKIVGCFAQAHDFKLVLLAAAVCALSSFTVVALLWHSRQTLGPMKALWLAIAAVAGGSGIWATHFIAMLAFAPGVDSTYDLTLTAVSLIYAVVLSGIGFACGALSNRRDCAMLGGTIVGGGIAAMHYTGMSAFEVAGHVRWNLTLVVISIICGAMLGAIALAVAFGSRARAGRVGGALLLVLAICSHHFTAMGAVTIVPDPRVVVPAGGLPTDHLAIAVAFASFLVLLFAGTALGIDLRDRRHATTEGERLRSLADAAVEGLIVCKGDIIVNANRSFSLLAGLEGNGSLQFKLSDYIPQLPSDFIARESADQPLEADLRRADGTLIPVELIMRPVEYANEPHYAVAIRDLRARRRAEGEIYFLAHHDPLTGLANRTSFQERIAQELKTAQMTHKKLAVLCLDLDGFKEVNDLFGHASGDAILEKVGQIITALLDDTQMVARLGGDEFAVLVPCTDAITAGTLAERIVEALRVGTGDQDGPAVGASIGIALFPDDTTDRQTLLNHADTALYRAKSEGRGTYRFFEAKMGAQVHERRVLEHDLRQAIARREFSLVYQPQHDVATGDLTGFEALLRWHHPTRGNVSPATFIHIAEECGLIGQIGEWVLREACREAAGWDRKLSIAVNVSAIQIHSPVFTRLVHEVLLSTGLSAQRLELEVTETALVRDQARGLLTLRQLQALGLRIAMDDFGTGYSSLSNLGAFPFNKIKIDASFIKSVEMNGQAAAIVRSILGLGRGLGVPVLAEGVETEGQLQFLEHEDCSAVQGYLLGRPAPIDQFSHVVRYEPDPRAGQEAAQTAAARSTNSRGRSQTPDGSEATRLTSLHVNVRSPLRPEPIVLRHDRSGCAGSSSPASFEREPAHQSFIIQPQTARLGFLPTGRSNADTCRRT